MDLNDLIALDIYYADQDEIVEDPPLTPVADDIEDSDMGQPEIIKSSIGKHLRSTNSSPLSSPSRDRTKRPKPTTIVEDIEDEGIPSIIKIRPHN